MITTSRPAYYDAPRYAEYCGLSTDDKTTIAANNGDRFYELDTAKRYVYNGVSGEWVVQPDDTTAVDTGLPAITSETAGHFLSNDGSVTHWQEFASADFIITLTENSDGTYTANKTWVEMLAAFEGKENIAVSIGNGDTRLPLMSAEIAANGDAGMTFGYTRVTIDGQLVSTRAVVFSHDADNPNDDHWTDSDQVGEYLKLNGGVMDGELNMGANSITNVQEMSTADTHPLYIGNVIHQSEDGVRITSTTNNEAAVVAPNSQAEYRPINVGTPTAPNHAVNLAYLTQEVKDEAATKQVLNFPANTGHTYTLSNGMYMLVTCDAGHSGVAVINIAGDEFKVSHVCTLSSWTVTKGAVTNSIYINNLSTTNALDVHVLEI